MKRFFILLLVLLSILLFNCQSTASKNLTHLTPDEFKSSINNDSIQLIDIRKPSEYATGHIPKAVNINYFSDDFFSIINKLNKEKPIYIYCRSGKRSAKSAFQFKKAGFNKIHNLQGGLLSWESRGFDILIKD